jgi:hypothetical protein
MTKPMSTEAEMLATKNTCLLFMIRNLERVVFIESSQICGGVAQRFALPALGRAAERRPIGKMLRRRKRLGIAPESPASGARFVRRLFTVNFSFS